MLLNKKQQQTPFASSLFELWSLIFCKLFSTSIAKIIQNLDPNKAHDHDNIRNRKLKMCGFST